MAEQRKLVWRGASGAAYEYAVYDVGFIPEAGLQGNYIFARQTPIGWYAVYIGQGDLYSRILNHPAGKQARKQATHIHLHVNQNEPRARMQEVKDLRAAHGHASTMVLFRSG